MKIFFVIVLAAASFTFINDSSRAQTMYGPTWESLSGYDCPDWFRDAKFGIFIHWGVYSVPGFGSEWYPRWMYVDSTVWGQNYYRHHLKKYGEPDQFGYKDFIPMFRAEKFDPDHWAEIFRKSGARYVVPVAEHHDGFAMYNTGLSLWNAMNMGPHRDIIGELAEAVRKQGLVFGVSSHRIEHWWFMNTGKQIRSDVQDPRFADFYGPAHRENEPPSIEYMNDWLLRCCELIDRYHPQLFWFDWWIEQPAMEPYRKTFAAYYYNHARIWDMGVVINYKNGSFPDDVAVYDIERGSSRATRQFPWQTDTSIGKRSWGWIADEENKTSDEIIDALIDIVSKNGNLLLNIGPRSDGAISPEQEHILLEIGEWLAINGEGIYGTRPWKIAEEGPTKAAGGSFADQKAVSYTPQDFRFTSTGENVFAFCLDIPAGKRIAIRSLGLKSGYAGKISSVSLLGSLGNLDWKQKNDALVITLPAQIQAKEAIGLKMSFYDK